MSNKSIEFLSENEKKHNHLGELKEAQLFGRMERNTSYTTNFCENEKSTTSGEWKEAQPFRKN